MYFTIISVIEGYIFEKNIMGKVTMYHKHPKNPFWNSSAADDIHPPEFI
jgi:hypothetical protein